MMNRYFSRLSMSATCLAASVMLVPLTAHAEQAPASIPKFAMSGAWGNYYLPPLLIEGEFGTQINLSPVDIKALSQNIYLERKLQERFQPITVDTASDSASEETSSDTGRFTAHSIEVLGQFDREDKTVNETVLPFEGQAISQAQIQELAHKLSDLYHDRGTACNVLCSLKEGDDGKNTLSIRLNPLKVRELRIEDGQYFKARAVKSHLSIDKESPLDLKKLQRNIRQIQSNPDITLETELTPVDYSNEVDVNVKIVDNRPYHVVNYMNNLNLNMFGENFMGTALVHNNITGHGDNLLVSGIFSAQGRGLISRYELPVGSRGTRLFCEYSYVAATPVLGPSFVPFNYQGHLHVITPGVQQILLDRGGMRLSTDFAFNIKRSEANAGSLELERERFHDLRWGVQLDRDDNWGNTSLRNEVGWGIDIFGGTNNTSPLLSFAGAGSNYFRYTGTFIRSQKMPWDTEAVFQAIVQLTPDQIPSFDQWGTGGTYFGRGYREGFFAGDSALLLTSEWRLPGFIFPKSWKIPFTEDTWRENTQIIPFLDYTQSHLNNQDPGQALTTVQLLGTGLGFNVKLGKYLSGYLNIAVPLLRATPFSQAPRFHFGIQSAIL